MKGHVKVNTPQINIASLTKLGQDFYQRDTELVARELIGKLLVRIAQDQIYAGMITETEAYLAEGDLASHSAVGMTPRNSAMFETGGTLYVYKIYGVHFCANVVTEPSGIGSAVLLRAVEPIIGIDEMCKNRNKNDLRILCNGPGKLCSAFKISKEDNFKSLMGSEIYIADYIGIPSEMIENTSRIGITKSADLRLRFLINNQFKP